MITVPSDHDGSLLYRRVLCRQSPHEPQVAKAINGEHKRNVWGVMQCPDMYWNVIKVFTRLTAFRLSFGRLEMSVTRLWALREILCSSPNRAQTTCNRPYDIKDSQAGKWTFLLHFSAHWLHNSSYILRMVTIGLGYLCSNANAFLAFEENLCVRYICIIIFSSSPPRIYSPLPIAGW